MDKESCSTDIKLYSVLGRYTAIRFYDFWSWFKTIRIGWSLATSPWLIIENHRRVKYKRYSGPNELTTIFTASMETAEFWALTLGAWLSSDTFCTLYRNRVRVYKGFLLSQQSKLRGWMNLNLIMISPLFFFFFILITLKAKAWKCKQFDWLSS